MTTAEAIAVPESIPNGQAVPVRADAYAALMQIIHDWEASRAALNVLEAGGGSLSYVNFDKPIRVTAVDISPEQLARNTYAAEKILGDLHTVALGTEKYDATVIWEVLEHVAHPRTVLARLSEATKPDGVIIIAVPNPASLQGFITKWTPHWFHVLVFRYAFGWKMAGKPGYAPFETVHHRDIRPSRMAAWAEANGLEVLFRVEYEGARRAHLRQKSPMIGACWDFALALGNLIMRRPLQASDVFMVLKKSAA